MVKILTAVLCLASTGCVGQMHFLKDARCVEDSRGSYYYKDIASSVQRSDEERRRYLECKRKIKEAKAAAKVRNTVVTAVSMVALVGGLAAVIAGVAASSGGGKGGKCPKCKQTRVRSDGIVQTYWVCC